jgi:cytochrome c oxidase subunit IV
MKDEKQYWLDKPGNLQRLLKWFYIICAALFAADFVIHRHVVHTWENLFGFYGIFGFVACVILVVVAKEMRKVLMRKEDYYDD